MTITCRQCSKATNPTHNFCRSCGKDQNRIPSNPGEMESWLMDAIWRESQLRGGQDIEFSTFDQAWADGQKYGVVIRHLLSGAEFHLKVTQTDPMPQPQAPEPTRAKTEPTLPVPYPDPDSPDPEPQPKVDDPIVNEGDLLLVGGAVYIFAQTECNIYKIIDLVCGNRLTDTAFSRRMKLSEIQQRYTNGGSKNGGSKIGYLGPERDSRRGFAKLLLIEAEKGK